MKPPKFAHAFLRWYCHDEYLEEIEGNLIEIFEREYEESPSKAQRSFFWNVLLHFRPIFIRSFSIPFFSTDLWNNYLKVAWRNTVKHKLYSSINLVGLTVGMTCFMLLALYIQFELSYDSHHENSNRLYRVYMQQKGIDFQGSDLFAVSPEPIAPLLRENFPEVEQVAAIRIKWDLLSIENLAFSPRVLYADEHVFNIFEIPIIEGIGAEALANPNAILLSESLAQKFFGSESALGKSILFDNHRPLTVYGIFSDVPENQHLQFEYILPQTTHKNYRNDLGKWDSNNNHTYLKLAEGVDPNAFKQKFDIFDKYTDPAYAAADLPFRPSFFIQPVQDVHFAKDINFNPSSTSDKGSLYLISLVGFIILLLAAINYMNLATARSARRSKELGMRKVMGAQRKQLIVQLLHESLLMTCISFVLAIGTVLTILPLFENLMGQSIPFEVLGDSTILYSMILTALIIGIVSGLYPALFMSGVSPVKAFKGTLLKNFSRGNVLRNGLIVGQFIAAIVLAISTVVVYQQLEYLQEKELGYNRDQIVYVPYWFAEIDTKTEVIRNELLTHPNIEKVSKSSEIPLQSTNQGIAKEWEGNEEGREFFIYRNYIDYNYLDVFEIELLAGRNFSLDHPTDSTESYILNEAAIQEIGWTPAAAIGKEFQEGTVIGVVKDFHFQTMALQIEPLWMKMRTPETSYENYGNISMKIATTNLQNTLKHIEQTFKKAAPGLPFEYRFMDDSYAQLYLSEQRLGRAFRIFTLLALLIACIGLFGIVSFSVVQRTKEIGIRKVLGASVLKILELLSKDFLKLVVIALVLAIPIAWYTMNEWLNNYAYRIDIQWWVFILVAALAIGIALLTVSIQSIRAAVANPTDSLHSE